MKADATMNEMETANDLEKHQGIKVRRTVKHGPVMRLTAQHMLASHTTAAHVTVFSEADASALVSAKNAFCSASSDPKVTYSHLLVKILSVALRRHPSMNAAYIDESLKLYDEVNIGLASSSADGNLVVPVIRSADELSIREIAVRVTELLGRARAGRQRLQDLQGGTCTLSNVGMLPSVHFTTPLLNLPQVAILGVGALFNRVIMDGGALHERSFIGLSLTFDHRAVNGFAAASFAQTIADIVSAPYDVLGIAG